MNCLNCRKPNADESRFCHNCGTVLPPSFEEPELPSATVASPPRGTKVDPLIGHTLDNRYRLDSKLRKGGMGTVYIATRLHIHDTVAVKILDVGDGVDPHSAERFRREAQSTASLKHPNAVSIYDFGVTADGIHYLVMELVEGQDLRAIIKGQGPLSLQMTLEIVNQVCAALEESHRHNIIHRDIKPDNIIVNTASNRPRVKVLDFGVAKLSDLAVTHITQAGSVMGTPHYMSPEQCMGEEIDSRSDIYSLGVVIYEMLCGVVPFNAPSTTAVVMQHVNQPPPRPRLKNPTITPAVEAVMLHALEKRPDARPQTAAALAQEFTDAAYGVAPAEHSTSTPVNNAAVTSRDAGPGAERTLFTPPSGSTFVPPSSPPPSGAQYFSGPMPQAAPKGKALPIILGIALLLVVAGATVVGVAWLLKEKPATATGDALTQNSSGKNQANGTGVTQPQTTVIAADSELRRIKAERSHATLADHPKIIAALDEAEAKYPEDYRFPYERAKLEVDDPGSHEKTVVGPLYSAGQIAITNDKAEEMLADLEKSKVKEFGAFSREHKADWDTLLEALRKKDKSLLEAEHPH